MKRIWIWGVAFVEGAVVMAVEIASAKLIAPWFGSSLYVWSSVLGVTLAGLAGGYFAGGWLSARDGVPRRLAGVLCLAGLLVMVMPLLGPAVMKATLAWEPRWGSLAAACVFLFPPILLLGMVSPLLVALGADGGAGRAAGTVYGVSTVGGIAMTFAMGFYIMPGLGLRLPLMALGVLLLLLGLALFLRARRWGAAAASLLLLGVGAGSAAFGQERGGALSQSWGMLGELAVVDEVRDGRVERVALLDGREQTRVRATPQGFCALHPYVAVMSRLAAMQPAGARCLLLGLGGGSLLGELDRLGHHVEGCEIDARMIATAQAMFGAPVQRHDLHAEDARWCINKMDGRYDLVLVDVFWGQQAPSHVLTLESLRQVHAHLHTRGMLAVLFPGPADAGHAQRLGRTMQQAGFQVSLAQPDGFTSRSLVLIGTHTPYGLDFFGPQGETPCAAASGIPAFVPAATFEADPSADLLVDDRPALEALMVR